MLVPFVAPVFLSRKLQSTGVSVRATSVEAKSDTMNATPRGISILPSMPERKKMGMKLTTMMKVEFSMGMRTSLEASNTTSSTLRLCPSGFRRFSLRRLNTLSTSTIASSTSEPMAIAMPPMLIVLMLMPLMRSTMMVISRERGMVTSEISVVLTFIRNRKSTRITNSAPSISALRILPIDASMKSL